MRFHTRLQSLTSAFLISGAICLSGCTSAGHRNLTEAVLVTASPSLAEDDVKFALELRDSREEFTLGEADAFLASDRAAKLSRQLRSQVKDRSQKLRRTMAEALHELSDGLALIKPNPQLPYADSNIVLYLAGKTDIHVLFSYAEIAQLLAFRQLADDLATIRYTHPGFDAARLRVLRDRLAALELDVENVRIPTRELDQMKAAAAARILGRELRESDVALPVGPPLLISGRFRSTRSPKLTEALKDQSVFEQIVRSSNPDVIRAFIYLVRRDVVQLEHP